MADPAPPWREGPDGLVLAVRLTPRGGRDGLDGIEAMADGRSVLKLRVRAAPSEGAANAALLGLIAELLAVRRRDVTLLAGASARLKQVAVAGDPAELSARMVARLRAA